MPYFRQGKFKIYLYYRWGFTNIDLYWTIYWMGISINKRVVQKAAKNTLLFISGLMIFWFIVRSIKVLFRDGCKCRALLMVQLLSADVVHSPGGGADGSSSWTARRVYFTEMVKVVIYSYNALLLACFDK